MSNTIDLYPLSNYSFATQEAQPEEDPSVNARLQRLQGDYEEVGMRKTVEGCLLVHEHGHPHLLVLQVANTFFKLPGDYLKPHEPEIEGLSGILNQRLGLSKMDDSAAQVDLKTDTDEEEEWEVAELIAKWYRPNFEGFMYPYNPAHIKKVKEIKSIYLVQLPQKKILCVPKNMKLLAIPLFELYDNAVRYGPQLSAIPGMLSRITFEYHD